MQPIGLRSFFSVEKDFGVIFSACAAESRLIRYFGE